MTVYRYRFDFEVGNLVKSPCSECNCREEFPRCMEECRIIDRIQAMLAQARSCSR